MRRKEPNKLPQELGIKRPKLPPAPPAPEYYFLELDEEKKVCEKIMMIRYKLND